MSVEVKKSLIVHNKCFLNPIKTVGVKGRQFKYVLSNEYYSIETKKSTIFLDKENYF